MKIGLITEGLSDQAVIQNIIKGSLGISEIDIIPIRPEHQLDATDKSKIPEKAFSNWTLVKRECQEGTTINEFLDFHGEDARIVIQIDTAECAETGFDVKRPNMPDFTENINELYSLVQDEMKKWIGANNAKILFAICIEETEAWVIPIYDPSIQETGVFIRPKERLDKILNRLPDREKTKVFGLGAYARFLYLSKPFCKEKHIVSASERNISLLKFYSLLKRI